MVPAGPTPNPGYGVPAWMSRSPEPAGSSAGRSARSLRRTATRCVPVSRARPASGTISVGPRGGHDRRGRRSRASTRSCTWPARASAAGRGPTSSSGEIKRAARKGTTLLATTLAGLDRAAAGPRERLGHRVLRRPGRRGADRDGAPPATTSSPRCAWPGRRRPQPAARGRHPGRAHPHRHRAHDRRRCAPEAAPAVQARASADRRATARDGGRGSPSRTRCAPSASCSTPTCGARSTSPRRTR